jgi:hypothetical protein
VGFDKRMLDNRKIKTRIAHSRNRVVGEARSSQ